MHALRFRQVHLDFHTSPDIAGIRARFDKARFQAALRLGRVDSITLFSQCHHGLSYHSTAVAGAPGTARQFEAILILKALGSFVAKRAG